MKKIERFEKDIAEVLNKVILGQDPVKLRVGYSEDFCNRRNQAVKYIDSLAKKLAEQKRLKMEREDFEEKYAHCIERMLLGEIGAEEDLSRLIQSIPEEWAEGVGI